MLLRYQTHFASLAPEHVSHVASAITRRHALPDRPDARSGEELWQFCADAGMDQADVVMSMADDATQMGVVCLETLIGHPIVRAQPKPERRGRQSRTSSEPRGAAVRRDDTRVLTAVAPNPKKPGSKSHARFACYRVGMTVSEAVAAGVTMDDVRHDLAHGFIVLEAAS